ncbi:uncharacterized protein LOC103926780 [Pyrus x bretschneideri]|uniref:uncharacterized protein LOC103926780 n=1 Tax=Pyrus x bretschneideri TaxID=225117 RepID=UPI00202FE56B|nr:uncharacterized protein LOC103926780 [Pyrus x bretschneideri]
MQDHIGIPACFSSGEKLSDDASAVARSGHSVYMSVYRAKIADQSRLITITWCKNLLLHGLSVTMEGQDGDQTQQHTQHSFKVELKPWYFWRKQGSKRFVVDGKAVEIFWDLKAAKFNGGTEPKSEYYVAVLCEKEVVLLLGDLKKDAYRKTGFRPALTDPTLVSKKEHIFGKKKFSTKAKFYEKGRLHEIAIECKHRGGGGGGGGGGSIGSGSTLNGVEPELEIRVDGHLVVHVKHLQWKFRGNESIRINKLRIEVYWDVHDWLFSPGLRHALFIFKPSLPASSTSLPPLSRTSSSSLPFSSSASTPLSSQTSSASVEGINASSACSSEFCLFLYAWKVE